MDNTNINFSSSTNSKSHGIMARFFCFKGLFWAAYGISIIQIFFILAVIGCAIFGINVITKGDSLGFIYLFICPLILRLSLEPTIMFLNMYNRQSEICKKLDEIQQILSKEESK